MIGVVTVTYNSAKVLGDFLRSLGEQTYQDFRLYVVDNASKDDTLSILQSYSGVQLSVRANQENIGVSEANNQAIRAALADGCDSVLMINNDVVLHPELISRLRTALEERACAMTTPKIYYYEPPKMIWAAGGYFQFWLGRSGHYGMDELDRGQYDRVREVTYTPTTCVLIDKTVFDRIGLLDPMYFAYYEDTDFMYRAWRAGFKMWYIPQALLWHKVSSLTGACGSDFTIGSGIRHRVYFVRKHFPVLGSAIWTGLYRLYLAARCLLRKDSIQQWRFKANAVSEGRALGKSS